MSDPDKKYIEILNRARKRRRSPGSGLFFLAGGAAALVLVVLLAVIFLSRGAGKEEASASSVTDGAGEIVLEGAERDPYFLEKIAVIESYENLGLVQVSGYLNVREAPSGDADIIGKLGENCACEVLDEADGWMHIISGEVEGYIDAQYVVTGEEAARLALEYVTPMAVVMTESLNIRSQPDLNPEYIIGQALYGERYAVVSEEEGWVQLEEGYVSADYVDVALALDEARRLDLKEMALNQYGDLVISKVNNYLNVRSDPSTSGESNIIGKLPGKAAGEILETLDGWYRIRSGPITGYISADPQYVAVGQEARDLALQYAALTAIVNTDRLNVRAEPSTDAKIWTQISKEERYHVVSQLDGWVEIEIDMGDSGDGSADDRAYISTRDNNVDVRYALTEAIKFSPLEEKANKQAALRSKVVNYALKFIGNRYVWGGTNPNTGADCSGFVQYVMRNAAGVSLPRTSREQAKVGTKITSSQMRPGDLIFYTNSAGTVNHVAIYIGNGQVVHAASTRSGIRISSWNYRTPKYIRRVLS